MNYSCYKFIFIFELSVFTSLYAIHTKRQGNFFVQCNPLPCANDNKELERLSASAGCDL